MIIKKKPQRATTEIWTSNDLLLYFLTMNNGSLNTNGISTQSEATMQRDGGWRKSSHYQEMYCIISVENKSYLFSQIVAVSCLKSSESLRPMLRWEKMSNFLLRKKHSLQLNGNRPLFRYSDMPFTTNTTKTISNNFALKFPLKLIFQFHPWSFIFQTKGSKL